jgi:hypothetical protein
MKKKIGFLLCEEQKKYFFLYNDKYTTIIFFKGLCHVKIKGAY